MKLPSSPLQLLRVRAKAPLNSSSLSSLPAVPDGAYTLMMVKLPLPLLSLTFNTCMVLGSMGCGGAISCRLTFQIMAVPGFPLSSKLHSASHPCFFTRSFNSFVFKTFSWRHSTSGLNLLNKSITFSLLLPPTLWETALSGGVEPPHRKF